MDKRPINQDNDMDEACIIPEQFIKIRKLNQTDDTVDFVNTLCLTCTIFRIQDH